jgi:hypothetical protein
MPNRTPEPGYVYVLRADTGLYKIGKSRNPNQRVAHFTLKLPFPVEILRVIRSDDYHAHERQLHAEYAAYRVNGEWFDLPGTVATKLLSMGEPPAAPKVRLKKVRVPTGRKRGHQPGAPKAGGRKPSGMSDLPRTELVSGKVSKSAKEYWDAHLTEQGVSFGEWCESFAIRLRK